MTRKNLLTPLRMLALALLAMATLAMPALAQDDDDDTKGDNVVTDATEFAAYIYEGTVDDIGDEPVDDAGALELLSENDGDPDNDAAEIWRAISSDETRPAVLYGDDDDTDLTLVELTDSPHVLVVHAGETADEPVIAAGTIDGEIEDGILLFDLHEVDDSGYEGRAFFGPNDEGEADNDREQDDDDLVDDDTPGDSDVIIALWQAATGEVDASPTS